MIAQHRHQVVHRGGAGGTRLGARPTDPAAREVGTDPLRAPHGELRNGETVADRAGTRRDVLDSAYHLMDPPKESPNRFLYVSALEGTNTERFG